MTTTGTRILQGRTLDGFARKMERAEGVNIHALPPFTTLLVETRNSVYRIVLLQRSRILVQGGQFFPHLVEAHLVGSSFGGSAVKMAWIGVGLRLEINGDGGRTITSQILNVRIQVPAEGGRSH